MISSFLAGIGTKLADRWLNALLLPGLLWTGTLAAGLRMGHDHPFAVAQLGDWLNQLTTRPAVHTVGTVTLAASAILLASVGVGLLAGTLGGLVERLWALPGDLPPASWLRARRQHRWDMARKRLKTAIRRAAQATDTRAALSRAGVVRARQRQQSRLGPARPSHITRIGDRFARTATRTTQVNGLDDLSLVWPRLWSVLPSELRDDLTTARTAYAATARLAAWGLLYLAISAVWWPAALIGSTVLATATVRGDAAANVLADLIESACDLHLTDLGDRLSIPVAASASDTGHAITERLRATASGTASENSSLHFPTSPPPSTRPRSS